MANVSITRPDPREAVMLAQDLAEEGNPLVSITLDTTAPVKGTVVYTQKAQNQSQSPAQRAADQTLLATAVGTLNTADAGGANAK